MLIHGTIQDYGFRAYRPDLARFFAVDPLAREYPYYTTYQFGGNDVIRYIDRDGLEPAYMVFGNGLPKVSLASDRLTHQMPANAVYRKTSQTAQAQNLRQFENDAENAGTGLRIGATAAGIVTVMAPNPVTAAITAIAATGAELADGIAVGTGFLVDVAYENKPLSGMLKLAFN